MLGVMEYWRVRESDWPHLAAMAYDFLSIPAVNSECERVSSSCVKMTTPESSRLSGSTLWHHECLKYWQRRGVIRMETYKNAVILDFKH
jgi:hAT family C-terminal dimerisation region